jgi:sugar phosphate isomerase/epimerase
MKYGIVISAESTDFGELILKGHLEENIKKAGEIGYDGIELAVKNPDRLNLLELHKMLEDNQLEMPVIGTGQIFFDEGLSFADPSKTVREEAVNRVCEIMKIAQEFGSSVIIGLVRGLMSNEDYNSIVKRQEIFERVRICVVKCLEYSEQWSGKLLIEPMHRYLTNIINTLDDGAEFICMDKVFKDSDRVGILADTWHMNIEESDMITPFIRNSEYLSHLHFADSNRKAPGYGHIDFKSICAILDELKYDGYASFEVLPLPNPDRCAKDALEHLKKINEHISVVNEMEKAVIGK